MSNLEYHNGLYHTAEDQLIHSHSPRFRATPITLQLQFLCWHRNPVYLKSINIFFDVGLTREHENMHRFFECVSMLPLFSLFPFPAFKSFKFLPNTSWSWLYLEDCGEVRGRKKVFAISLFFQALSRCLQSPSSVICTATRERNT